MSNKDWYGPPKFVSMYEDDDNNIIILRDDGKVYVVNENEAFEYIDLEKEVITKSRRLKVATGEEVEDNE